MILSSYFANTTLGGGHDGEELVMRMCTEPTPRTVVGYLSQVLASGPGATLPDPSQFVIKAHDHNKKLTDNIFLLCGDGNLEPMAPAISGIASQPALTAQAEPWRWVHLVFRNLINDVVNRNSDRDWMVFVDTNPSFSIYTELAMCSVDRLISPVNADDSSRVATNAMFILLHGQIPPHPVYGSWTFAAKAIQHQVQVPGIHLIVGNRLTQNLGPAAAFAALSNATADTLYTAYRQHPAYFTPRDIKPRDLQEFRNAYSVPLRDFNTAGVVAAHLGERLSQLNNSYYTVHGSQVQVNRDRVKECLQAIDDVIAEL